MQRLPPKKSKAEMIRKKFTKYFFKRFFLDNNFPLFLNDSEYCPSYFRLPPHPSVCFLPWAERCKSVWAMHYAHKFLQFMCVQLLAGYTKRDERECVRVCSRVVCECLHVWSVWACVCVSVCVCVCDADLDVEAPFCAPRNIWAKSRKTC